MIDDFHKESLAYYLERSDYHANQLGLTRVVARLRRLREIVPEVPERAPGPDPVVRTGPRTIEHPIDKRTIHDQLERLK